MLVTTLPTATQKRFQNLRSLVRFVGFRLAFSGGRCPSTITMAVLGRFVLGCLVISAVLQKGSCSTEFGGPNVVHLTTSDFKEKTADGSLWLIKFFAPWCGHCKRLAGTWKDLGDEFKDKKDVNIAHVDCTTDKEVCADAQIKGYPTLILFFGGEEHKIYKGQRDVATFKKFLDDEYASLMSETTS